MSGYDIQHMLQTTNADRWGGVLLGSIYHALKKMEQEGYVEIASIEQSGHRQKALYRITESGKEYLKELVRDALAATSVKYPSTLYAGISYIDKIPPEEARQALEQQRRTLDDECTAVRKGLETKSEAMQHDISPMTKLVFDNMLSIIRQQQDFVERALQLL